MNDVECMHVQQEADQVAASVGQLESGHSLIVLGETSTLATMALEAQD